MNKPEWEDGDYFAFSRNSRIPRGSLGEPLPPSRPWMVVAIAVLIVAIAMWPAGCMLVEVL
jgi:hypothetical protein